MIPVIWQSYNPERSARLFGDQIMLNEVFEFNKEYEHRRTFKEYESFQDFYVSGTLAKPGDHGAIVTMALEDNKQYIEQLNHDLRSLEWCIVILTQNEYGSKAYQQIRHPNMKLWIQTPAYDDVADKFIPLGYPSIVRDHMKEFPKERKLDWFFAGQISHGRRKECAAGLEDIPNGIFFGTDGFNEGLDYHSYVDIMINSKIVLCPAGPETPDTFRIYEALEAGCIPIIDMYDGHSDYREDFWQKIFGEHPLVMQSEWSGVDGAIELVLQNYEKWSVEVAEWWANYKTQLGEDIMDTIYELKTKGKNK